VITLAVGFALGVVAVFALYWRRLTIPADRRLQLTIDDLTIEVGELYRSNERLARQLVEASSRRNNGTEDTLRQDQSRARS
jgi:hypothetical protein